MPGMRRPKRFKRELLRKVDTDKWWCSFGQHSFVWTNHLTAPLDCPDGCATKDALYDLMEQDRELKIMFLEMYPAGLRSLSMEQLGDFTKIVRDE